MQSQIVVSKLSFENDMKPVCYPKWKTDGTSIPRTHAMRNLDSFFAKVERILRGVNRQFSNESLHVAKFPIHLHQQHFEQNFVTINIVDGYYDVAELPGPLALFAKDVREYGAHYLNQIKQEWFAAKTIIKTMNFHNGEFYVVFDSNINIKGFYFHYGNRAFNSAEKFEDIIIQTLPCRWLNYYLCRDYSTHQRFTQGTHDRSDEEVYVRSTIRSLSTHVLDCATVPNGYSRVVLRWDDKMLPEAQEFDVEVTDVKVQTLAEGTIMPQLDTRARYCNIYSRWWTLAGATYGHLDGGAFYVYKDLDHVILFPIFLTSEYSRLLNSQDYDVEFIEATAEAIAIPVEQTTDEAVTTAIATEP